MKKLGVVSLIKFGSVLSSREKGRRAADLVQDTAEKFGGVVISFDEVQIATPSFLDEVVTRSAQLLRGSETLMLYVSGLDSEVRESLELVVRHRDLRLAVIENDAITLLGGSEQLKKTLAEAQKLGEFMASQLADEMKVKLPALHQRLSALLESGAVVREPDPEAKRGKRHVYFAANPRDIETSVAS